MLLSSLSRFLTSRRIATVLLLLLIVLFILYVLVPQEATREQIEFQQWQSRYPVLAWFCIQSGLTHLPKSFLFISIALFICASVLVCTLKRTVNLFSLSDNREIPAAEFLQQTKNSYFLQYAYSHDDLFEKLHVFLSKKRYQLVKNTNLKDGQILAVKGGIGKWGSIIFHGSFLVVFLGVLVSTWTRFDANFILSEKQSMQGRPSEYLGVQRMPFASTHPFDFHFSLNKLVPSDKFISHYVSEVEILENSDNRHLQSIRPFHPLSYKGFTFYQKGYGFSPRFVIKRNNEILFDAYVALHSEKADDKTTYIDYFTVPQTAYTIEANFQPDKALKSHFFETGNLEIASVTGIDIKVLQAGQILFQGPVTLNQPITLGNNTLTFSDLRFWCGFRVVKDSGITIIFTGFILGVIGLLVRVFNIKEKLLIEITSNDAGAGIDIYGSAEREKEIFSAKLSRIVKELEGI